MRQLVWLVVCGGRHEATVYFGSLLRGPRLTVASRCLAQDASVYLCCLFWTLTGQRKF